jgi:CRP-like cAMP-binding protein
LLHGLDAEQLHRLAGLCTVAVFESGAVILRQGEVGQEMHVLLRGEATIEVSGSADPVGVVSAGECLGEMSLLTGAVHSATARARTPVETAVLAHPDLTELLRLRPDIGLRLYRNLAVGLGEKLKRSGGR